MIKICNESIITPLKIIFDESLKNSVFPEIWKTANVVPVHKKDDKNLVKIIALSVYFQFLVKSLRE